VKEPDYEAMTSSGKLRYLPPRFMTVNTAIEQLLEVEGNKGEVRHCHARSSFTMNLYVVIVWCTRVL
jgi:diphthamide biosynthesis methyltransferase